MTEWIREPLLIGNPDGPQIVYRFWPDHWYYRNLKCFIFSFIPPPMKKNDKGQDIAWSEIDLAKFEKQQRSEFEAKIQKYIRDNT